MVLAGESFSEYATLDHAGVLEFPDVLVLVSVRVVLVLLTRQRTTRIKLVCVNATEHVMLVRSPADQHAFHDELPGAGLTVDAHASQNHTCAGSSDCWSPF